MNRADDPYLNILGMMQEEGKVFNTVPFLIGKVTATEPLTVLAGDIPITRENMKISSMLLPGYGRSISIAETSATGTTGSASRGGNSYDAFASHSHSVDRVGIPSGQMTMTDGFSVGDEVVLLVSEDGQQFILVCKVV